MFRRLRLGSHAAVAATGGTTSLEYALLAVCAVAAIASAVVVLDDPVNGALGRVATTVAEALAQVTGR